MTDLIQALDTALAHRGREAALTAPVGRRGTLVTMSGRELRAQSDTIAGRLQQAGMAPGDRVLFSARSTPPGIALALGIVKAGGTVVFADPGAGEPLFVARMELAAPTWVAAEPILYAASLPPVRPVARSRGIDLPDYRRIIPGAKHIAAGAWMPGVPAGVLSWRSLTRGMAAPRPVTEDTDALIVFTGGTTAEPKAVIHTRHTLGAGLQAAVEGLGLEPGMRVLAEQLMIGIPAMIAGGEWVSPPTGLDPAAAPETTLGLLPEVDAAFLTPAGLHAVMHAMEAPMQHVRRIILGGAPVLPPLIARARVLFPQAQIKAVYGMTEILPVAIADGAEKLARSGEGDYVGTLAGPVEARLAGDGELMLSGPTLARAYLHQLPAELDELPTGDFARLEGRELTLLGRKKDMLIRDKQNIYPSLYEPTIAGLAGVREAYIVGVPDDIGDDRVVLALVAEGSEDAEPALRDDAEALALAQQVEAQLPGLIDQASLPDHTVVITAVPRAGRGRKPDRAALSQLVARVVA